MMTYDRHIGFMKVFDADSVAAVAQYFRDQNDDDGCYSSHLGRMIRTTGAGFGFN
jgi:hypothetical protein